MRLKRAFGAPKTAVVRLCAVFYSIVVVIFRLSNFDEYVQGSRRGGKVT